MKTSADGRKWPCPAATPLCCGPMNSPLYVALDFSNGDLAFDAIEALGPSSRQFKIGLQLLLAAGPFFIRELVARGDSVFLDLKLHEIPTSVESAVHEAGKLGASMVTVHACAGSSVLKAAVRAASRYPSLQVLALTVITSLSDADLPEIGLPPSVDEQVERLTLLAGQCGCHGVVCSPLEAARSRSVLGNQGVVVCPGIQVGAGAGDHSRSASAADAARNGATYVVAGRAITGAPVPSRAAEEVINSFSLGVRQRLGAIHAT